MIPAPFKFKSPTVTMAFSPDFQVAWIVGVPFIIIMSITYLLRRRPKPESIDHSFDVKNITTDGVADPDIFSNWLKRRYICWRIYFKISLLSQFLKAHTTSSFA